MSNGNNSQLTGGRELPYVTQKDAYVGSLFQRIIRAINLMADNVAVSPIGKLPPPDPINGIQVQGSMDSVNNVLTAPSEHLHFVLTHNPRVRKGVQYISEISTEPNFLQPHVLDHGCSRSGFVHLPTFKSDGVTPQVYYLRSYAQYHGSDPSARFTFGGQNSATKIVMTGTSGTTLLPSTGSGTATPDGQQGGKGLGVVLVRPPQGPKRNVS